MILSSIATAENRKKIEFLYFFVVLRFDNVSFAVVRILLFLALISLARN